MFYELDTRYISKPDNDNKAPSKLCPRAHETVSTVLKIINIWYFILRYTKHYSYICMEKAIINLYKSSAKSSLSFLHRNIYNNRFKDIIVIFIIFLHMYNIFTY